MLYYIVVCAHVLRWLCRWEMSALDLAMFPARTHHHINIKMVYNLALLYGFDVLYMPLL